MNINTITNKYSMVKVISSILLMAIILSCSSKNQSYPEYLSGPYEPSWESLAQHETPQWFEDAVLGIYFHWGIYSVPAFGCWGGRNMYMPEGGTSENWGHIEDQYENTYDYVKQVYGEPGLEFGYRDFIPMFKAENWNPDEWADLPVARSFPSSPPDRGQSASSRSDSGMLRSPGDPLRPRAGPSPHSPPPRRKR